ncbi:MAG: hypothetical protein IPJ34_13140 [Myxococcales bacterium]|nr:hypothetical protein [Myxococcales bacterium]
MKAERSHVEAMANADEVGRQLRNAPRKWNRDHVFVSSVRFAKGFTLFMNTKKGSSITLEGSAPILEEVIGGRARAGTSVKVSGDAGLKAVGVTGGLYVDLMRLHWLGGTKPLRDEEVELLPVAAAITTP